MRCFLAATVLTAFCTTAAANTIWVPDDHSTIQAAIVAANPGDEVVVRPGTYVGNVDFLGKAITVRSDLGPEVTVLLGVQAQSRVYFGNGEGPSSVLQGFMIYGNDYGGGGGAIYCSGSSPRSPGTSSPKTRRTSVAESAARRAPRH